MDPEKRQQLIDRMSTEELIWWMADRDDWPQWGDTLYDIITLPEAT